MASIVKLLTWLPVGSSSLPGGLFCFARGLAFIIISLLLLARNKELLFASSVNDILLEHGPGRSPFRPHVPLCV